MIRNFLFRSFAVAAIAIAIGPPQSFGQVTGKLASQVSLDASTSEGPLRTRATLTVLVSPASGAAESKPTGSVSFLDGDQSIGSAFLDGEGRATYIVDALPVGERKIAAVYAGDDRFAAAASAPAIVNSASSGVPGFTLSATTASLSVVAGGTATTVITATPENGFNQSVALSCSGIPYASSSCIFSPSQVTPGPVTAAAPNGTPAISTLSILTTAPSGALLRPSPSSQIAYALVLPGILALAGLGLARKRALFGSASSKARTSALLLLLLAGGLGLSSCSQRYSYFHRPPAGNPGTPVGTYTVLVSGITGPGSSLSTATVQLTLTVTAK